MLERFKTDEFVIHCKTYEEWESLIDYTYDNIGNMRDISRERWYAFYYNHPDKICLRHNKYCVCYGDYDSYCGDISYDIITYHEFQNNILKIPMPSKCDLMDFLI